MRKKKVKSIRKTRRTGKARKTKKTAPRIMVYFSKMLGFISRISGYLFLAGLISAVAAGIIVNVLKIGSVGQAWISIVFVSVGLVVGIFMSPSRKVEEQMYFLLVIAVTLLAGSNLGIFAGVWGSATELNLGGLIRAVTGYVSMFSATAVIVLAVRSITNFRFRFKTKIR